jgi:hypothetical protein
MAGIAKREPEPKPEPPARTAEEYERDKERGINRIGIAWRRDEQTGKLVPY